MPSHKQLTEIFLRNNLRFRDQAELQSMAKAAREFYELGRAQALEDAAIIVETSTDRFQAENKIRALAEQAKGGSDA